MDLQKKFDCTVIWNKIQFSTAYSRILTVFRILIYYHSIIILKTRRNCISTLSSRNTLLISLCLSVSSWTPRAKPADMIGKIIVLCSSKVSGSQAGYPKACKIVQYTIVQHVDIFGHHFKIELFQLEIMELDFTTILEKVLKNILIMVFPIFKHKPPLYLSVSVYIWLRFRRKCFYYL